MIIAKIDVTKLDKAHFFKGQKGIYADLVLIPNKDGTDQYGNDGFVSQGVSKDARDKGTKGAIVGNYRKVNRGNDAKPAQQQAKPAPAPADEHDDVPF